MRKGQRTEENVRKNLQVIHRIFILFYSHILPSTLNLCIMMKKLYFSHRYSPTPLHPFTESRKRVSLQNPLFQKSNFHKLNGYEVFQTAHNHLNKSGCWVKCILFFKHVIPGDHTSSNMNHPLEETSIY